jgi:O-acetyl-ADP-ribose deacetylase (regulator of RNase III)
MEKEHITAFNAAAEKHKLPDSVNITIHNDRLDGLDSSIQFDAIVSPANSYGRMDGGFDDALSRAFTPKDNYHGLTRVAQAALYKEYRGFLPPGSCLLVDLEGQTGLKPNDWGCKYLALCPTMKIPQDVKWDREVVYECIWTLLAAIDRHNRGVLENASHVEPKEGQTEIRSILMTPMATGCGFWSAQRWAEQTVLAIKQFVDAVENEEKWKSLKWGGIREYARQLERTYGRR